MNSININDLAANQISQHHLLEAYQQVRAYTESLCAPLEIEDYLPQAVDYTSPPKWHLAHTTWFFECMVLKQYVDNYQPFDNQFHFLFNSYYQSLGERAIRGQRGIMSRPTVKQVYQYRQHVDVAMEKLINNTQLEELTNLIVLGLNHEQQHQELLLTDLKYTLSLNPIFPVYQAETCMVESFNTKTGWENFKQGNYIVGYQDNGFCFDNELGQHQVYLNDYSLNHELVTNAEYIEFIENGGYSTFHYWLDDGWHWLQQEKITQPLYWLKQGNEWYYYTLAGLKPINPDAILCHISYYEAAAYATYKDCRLATEFEWEVASQSIDWGACWEWTQSAYTPYPDFTIRDGAVGEYNGKFMINQMVLRGKSTATSPGHSRSSYRNFFHPHLQWQLTGIRLAR